MRSSITRRLAEKYTGRGGPIAGSLYWRHRVRRAAKHLFADSGGARLKEPPSLENSVPYRHPVIEPRRDASSLSRAATFSADCRDIHGGLTVLKSPDYIFMRYPSHGKGCMITPLLLVPSRVRAILIFCALISLTPASFGQVNPVESLDGEVHDSTSGLLAGTQVTLTNTKTNVKMSSTTNDPHAGSVAFAWSASRAPKKPM